VLGEKLVIQQRQTYETINQVLQMVSGFAESTQLLLDAFLEHEHAIPKIELNLEKTIKHRDLYRTRPRFIRQPDRTIRLPSKRIRIFTGYTEKSVPGPPANTSNPQASRQAQEPSSRKIRVPNYTWITIPGATTRVPSPPRVIPGRYRTRNVRQKINFEAIIGGEENPRFTAPIATIQGSTSTRDVVTPVGEKTGQMNRDLEDIQVNLQNQQERLVRLSAQVSKVLSKNQFVN
jgi:hypothetical protein